MPVVSAGSTVNTFPTTPGGMNAYSVQVLWQSGDFPTQVCSHLYYTSYPKSQNLHHRSCAYVEITNNLLYIQALTTVTSTVTSTHTTTTTPGLDTRGKVGIGIGVPIALLAVAIALWICYRFGKQHERARQANVASPYLVNRAELPGQRMSTIGNV